MLNSQLALLPVLALVSVVLLTQCSAAEWSTVASLCDRDLHKPLQLHVMSDVEGTLTVFDAELNYNLGESPKLMFATLLEDAFSGTLWGLSNLSPLASLLPMQILVSGDTHTCKPVVKHLGSSQTGMAVWRTMLILECDWTWDLSAVGQYEVTLQSNPAPEGSSPAQIRVCVEQAPAAPQPGAVATCVRPFRPFFYNTTERSVSDAQVQAWVRHHVEMDVSRIYLFDRYDAGNGPADPTLHNILKNEPKEAQQRVTVWPMPYFSSVRATFDDLVTPSYIYDQLIAMEMCFMQARREGISWVAHIDWDEYLHFNATPKALGGKGISSLREAFTNQMEACIEEDVTDYQHVKGMIIARKTIEHAKFDPPAPEWQHLPRPSVYQHWAPAPAASDYGVVPLPSRRALRSSGLVAQSALRQRAVDGRRLLFQGWGDTKWNTNVKSAFFASGLLPEDAYTVHVPVALTPESACLPDPNILWMSHLVDAYSERSFVYHAKAEARAAWIQGTASGTSSSPSQLGSGAVRQVFCVVALLLSMGVLIKLCESRSRLAIILAGAAALIFIADLGSSHLLHEGGLIHLGSSLLQHGDLRHSVRSAAAVASHHAAIRAQLSPDLPAGTWLTPLPDVEVSPLPSQLTLGSPLSLAVLQSFEGPQPGRNHTTQPALRFLQSYAVRLQGPESSMDLLSCDWSRMTDTLVCRASVSPRTPGTYTVQLWRFTKAQEQLHPADSWMVDARMVLSIVNHTLEVLPQATSSSTTATTTSAAAAAAPGPEARGGRWMRLDCDLSARAQPQLGLAAAIVSQLCTHNLYLQPNTTWKSFTSWDALFGYFASVRAAPQGQQLLWVDDGLLVPEPEPLPEGIDGIQRRDPQHAPARPFRFLPDLAPLMSNTWVHLSGDSTSFTELAAHYTMLSRHFASTAMHCAPTLGAADPATAYSDFTPCSSVWGRGEIDRSHEHNWLWLISVPELNLHISYTWSLTPAGLQHIHTHLTDAADANGRAAALRRVLSFRHGVHSSKDLDESQGLNNTKQLTALTSNQDGLLRTYLHDLAQLLQRSGPGAAALPAFDAVLVQGPASTAVDIQSWSMDVEAVQLTAQLLRRWVAAQGPHVNVKYMDLLPMTLPRAWSWALSPGPDACYMDNVHYTGNLLWALALKQLNTYAWI